MTTLSLCGDWQVTCLSPEKGTFAYTAPVPGCAFTDMLRMGRIEDPFWRFNNQQNGWIEQADYTYVKTFTADAAAPGAYLEFDGLDTFCSVWLNGEKLGEADDMFLRYRFPVGEALRAGENTLEVRFRSAVREVADKPLTAYAFTGERVWIRRMQCTFRWDWVDRFVTCGIFKPARLCCPGKAELAVSYTHLDVYKRQEYIKRRCDFWEFVGESVAENYFGTIQNWCHAHGLKSSGHMLEEERLQAHVYNYGSLYKCGKRMDWPGIDQLDSEPQRLMNTGSIPIARLLASFADVSGENESFTEFSDHTSRMENKQIGMNWIRSSVNWHYAMGINNLTSYYNFENFTDDEVKALNLYASRLGYLIRQGKRDSKVAVLYPEAAIWATYTPSTEVRAIDPVSYTHLDVYKRQDMRRYMY